MPQQPSLIDKLLDQKANRPAAQTYEGVSQWWKQSFGGEMPVKNIGESEFERRNQHEHSRAFDVGINPNSAQGQKFITYLKSQGIPYSAFDKAITRNGVVIASGPHIHVGIPSPKLGTSQPAESLVDRLLKAKDGGQEVKGDYLNQSVDHTKSLDKLARDIEWHFGYSTLQAFPKLPVDKQKQIAQLASQYAAADEVKKKNGQLITKSSAWQELNRRRVQLQLPDVLNPEEEQQQGKMEKDAYARRSNGLLRLGPKSRWLIDMLATGGAGLYDFAAGALNQGANAATLETRRLRKQPDLIDKAVGALRSGAATVRDVSAEAESVEPTGKVSKLVKGIGSGAVEYAPMMALPEAGIESVLGRIGASAATFGGYSGLQASGRGESAKGVAKETVTGAALGSLFGVPLPGKSILTKGLSNLVIMGGGGTVVNLATGKSLSDSATQGLALMLLRSPELLKGIKVRDSKGERPATVDDVKGIRTGVAEKAVSPQVEEAVRSGAKKAGVETGAVERAIQPEPTNEQQPRPVVAAPVKSDDTKTADKFAGQGGTVGNYSITPGKWSGFNIIDPHGNNLGWVPDRESAAENTARLASQLQVEKYQWMRNKEGGQSFGTQTEVYPLTEKLYNAYIKTATTDTTPLNAFQDHGIAAAKRQSFSEWKAGHPDVTHLALYRPEGRGKLVLQNVGTLTDVRPAPEATQWAKRVGDFSSSEAKAFGARADSSFKAGQEGAVNAANLPGVRTVLKAQQTASAIASKRGVWDFMRYTRDVADNKARIFGQTNSRELDIKLRRSLGLPKWGLSTKTQALAQDALTFVVESNGNPAELQTMRQKIAASTQALPGWKKRSLRAIDFAEQNYGKLAPVAQEYNTLTDAQRTQELSNGVKSYYRPGYVMHAQEIEGEMGWLEGGGGTGSSGFRHQRTYDTYADSIAAGINPKSLNAVDLLRTRLTNGQSMLNRRAWVDSLRTTVDPKTTLPVVGKVTIDPVTHVAEAPTGYSVESVGPQQVAVQKGYEGVFSALNDPSWWQSHTAGRILNRTNAAGKTVSLALDTFHLGRLAFWESVIKAGGLKTFKIPLPSYSRGITLLDTSLPEIQNMIARGELKASDYPQLVQNKQRLDLLVDHGYNIGNISDALYADVLHKLPIVGEFNKWLFGQFQRGAMTEVGLLEFERLKAARGSIMTDEAIARQVAKDLNTRFGNLGRQGWFSGKTAQDTMRLLFLAPQWNEGLIKSEFGAVKQTGQAVVDVIKGKPFYVGPLARSVGVLAVSQFVANQMINLITRGHPTWQNPEEGFGAKISAWIPDKFGGSGGFFLHPFGLAAETSLLLSKGYSRAAGVMKTPGSKKEAATEAASALTQDFNDYLRSRASIATRGAWVVASRRDYLGRSIKPENLATQAAKEALPKPIPAPAIWDAVFGHPYPGEFQSRLLSSFGIRTERAPSGEQRIRTLAREFNQSKGVGKQGEFYESPYMQLTETKSPEAAKELLKSKTKEQVLKYYEQRVDKPLTGSSDREREFLKTLNPEQRGQYFAAKGQRRQDLSEIRKLLASIGK
jgi:hypothetical protein